MTKRKAGPVAITFAFVVLIALVAFTSGIAGFGALMGFELGNRVLDSIEAAH